MTAMQNMAAQLMSMHSKPDRRTRIIQLAKSGMSQRNIAFEVGVSRTTVFNVLSAQRAKA